MRAITNRHWPEIQYTCACKTGMRFICSIIRNRAPSGFEPSWHFRRTRRGVCEWII